MQEPIILSQSLTKALGYYFTDELHILEVCPKLIYHAYILEDVRLSMSEPMLYGMYGETLILGKAARGNALHDLPRRKLTKKQLAENAEAEAAGCELPHIGDKKAVQQRIERQAELFEAVKAERLININKYNTQVPIIAHFKDNIYIRCEVDLVPSSMLRKGGLDIIAADIKFTQDVNNTFYTTKNIPSTSVSCYGDPDKLIKNQILMYSWCLRNINLEGMCYNFEHHADTYRLLFNDSVLRYLTHENWLFYLIVFGYGSDVTEANRQLKFIPFAWDDIKEANLNELIEQAAFTYSKFREMGWPCNPEAGRCHKCPMIKTCNEAIKEKIY